MSSEPKISNNSLSLSWEQAAIASQRERAAEGMILGGAIGEALALSRDGLPKWTGLRIFGRSPLRFQYVPGYAVPGEHTHAMLMTLQAIFQSRVDHRLFGRSLKQRMQIYRGVRALSHLKQCFINRDCSSKGEVPDYRGLMGNPLVRSLAIALLVQGASNAKPWLEQSNQCSRVGGDSMGPALLVAHSMQIAQLFEIHRLDGISILECLTDNCESLILRERLGSLAGCLRMRWSVARVSKLLGYSDGVPRKLEAVALLSVYSWLRHPNRFRIAVERAALLGGECAAVAAITGALAGASLGKKSIPPEWRKNLLLFPYSHDWVQNAIARIKDWPHGVEDIQAAHGEPVHPFGQLLRNMGLGCFQVVHTAIRLPTAVLPKSRAR